MTAVIEAEVCELRAVQIDNNLVDRAVHVLKLDVHSELEVIQIEILILVEFLVRVAQSLQHRHQALAERYSLAHQSFLALNEEFNALVWHQLALLESELGLNVAGHQQILITRLLISEGPHVLIVNRHLHKPISDVVQEICNLRHILTLLCTFNHLLSFLIKVKVE